MPLYDYRCTKCGHLFDDMVGLNDLNPPCPALPMTPPEGDAEIVPCGGETVKVPSRVGRPLGGPTPIHYRNRGVS